MKSYEPVFRGAARIEAGPLGTTRAIITSLIGQPDHRFDRDLYSVRRRAENQIAAWDGAVATCVEIG